MCWIRTSMFQNGHTSETHLLIVVRSQVDADGTWHRKNFTKSLGSSRWLQDLNRSQNILAGAVFEAVFVAVIIRWAKFRKCKKITWRVFSDERTSFQNGYRFWKINEFKLRGDKSETYGDRFQTLRIFKLTKITEGFVRTWKIKNKFFGIWKFNAYEWSVEIGIQKIRYQDKCRDRKEV